MSTLRISNIEAKSVPASATVDEKVKITNSSGDVLVFLDGKTSGITTVGINTTDGNITFDANSNVVVTGIITATKFVGTIEPTDLTVSGKVSVGGSVTAATFYGNGANLTGISAGTSLSGSTNNTVCTVTGANAITGEANLKFDGTNLDIDSDSGHLRIGDDQDLDLYHNGSNGYLKNSTGQQLYRSGTHTFENAAGNSTYASVDTNNHLLYTAGLERFRIYNDGVVAIGQSSKSGTVGAGGLDIQGNATNCIIEMGNPFPGFSGGTVPEFRITATNSSHEVKFDSIWGGDNALHPHMAFTGGRTIFYRGTNSDEIARFDGTNFGINRTNPSSLLHVQGSDTSTYNINSAVTNGILTISSDAGGGVGKCVGLQFNGPCSNGEGFITMVGISNSEMDMHFGMRSGGNRGDKVIFSSNGRVRMPGVWSTNGSNMRDVQIESDGTLCAGNTSVRASKINITSQTDISWLYDLNPVTFNYRKKIVDKVTGIPTYFDEAESETSYGLIAEEVETVKKDFCFYNKDKLEGVHYNQLITPLLKAIQDQKKEIDTLKAKVATLEGS